MASIKRLQIENFMKLTAVDIDINGRNVVVSGKNEIGKSTAINAIWYALTGKDIPDEPIKKGKESASIIAEVKRDDGSILVCTRKFKKDGPGTLTVSTPEGANYKSPQKFLDELLGRISFNPFEFIGLEPAKQKKELQRWLGIDTTELDAKKSTALADKKAMTDSLKTKSAELNQFPVSEKELTIRELTEVADKQKEIKEAQEKKDKLKEAHAEAGNTVEVAKKFLEDGNANVVAGKEKLDELLREAAELRVKIQQEEKEVQTIQNNVPKLERVRDDFNKEWTDTIVPDDKEVTDIITEINEHNKKVEEQEKRKKVQEAVTEIQAKIQAKNKTIEELDDERIEIISSANMPIPGLDFSEDGLTFEGLPFSKEQFSTGRMDEIGMNIVIALNPSLKILRFKNWSMFDSERKESIMKKAKEHSFQVFAELVSDANEIGFSIQE